MKINPQNERTKRRYLKYMQLAKRYSASTVLAHERAIEFWEIFTCQRDFHRITAKSAGEFASWLKARQNNRKPLSASTQCQVVRLVKSFYLWLATQPGRNSKSIAVALGYLTVEREIVAEASSPGRRKVPSLAYVKRLANSIKIEGEVDRRDRAIIAFLLLSGARASAAATLPLGCFDRGSLTVYQDPGIGVKTKNRKYIRTRLLPVDQELLAYFLEWYDYLREGKLWGDQAPLFPVTMVIQGPDSLSFEAAGVKPEFWTNGSRIDCILKERAAAAGLELYDCHSLRHTHVRLAFSMARTGEELKAISQNIGHEHFATTASVYGHMDEEKVGEVVGSLEVDTRDDHALSRKQRRALNVLLGRTDLTDDN